MDIEKDGKIKDGKIIDRKNANELLGGVKKLKDSMRSNTIYGMT